VQTTTIKERPILFSGPMVRAILEGRKTQTRRIVKGKGTWDVVAEERGVPWPGAENDLGDWQDFECPYGEIGERLWVRESFCADFKPMIYQATAKHSTYGGERVKYKPSIHMPRHLSRINLEITGVRVEPLNEISQQDAVCEGVEGAWENNDGNPSNAYGISAVRQFEALWKSINGDDSWDANPWVWVVEFKRV
jgi:hypothetical protein